VRVFFTCSVVFFPTSKIWHCILWPLTSQRRSKESIHAVLPPTTTGKADPLIPAERVLMPQSYSVSRNLRLAECPLLGVLFCRASWAFRGLSADNNCECQPECTYRAQTVLILSKNPKIHHLISRGPYMYSVYKQIQLCPYAISMITSKIILSRN